MNNEKIQSVSGLIILLGGGMLLGTLIAPVLFNGMLFLGRHVDSLAGWRDIEFEKVGARCVLLCVLLMLFPALSLNGLLSWRALGMSGFRRDHGLKKGGLGLLAGLASMAVLFAAGVWTGAYEVQSAMAAGGLWAQGALFVIGALMVGVVEELIFRGGIFGMARRGCGVVGGALVAGVLFAGVHFADPEPPDGVVYGHWYAGLRMIPYMFTPHDFIAHNGYLVLTLLCMGIMLCFFYVTTGNLYFGIGLHAGWVWAMRMGALIFVRHEEVLPMVFGPSMTVAKSGAAFMFSLLFLLVAAGWWVRGIQKGGTGD